MAPDKTTLASLANLCLLFMTELAMPETALEEFVKKVCCTNGLESLASVKYWELVTAHHFSPKKKVVMGPFKPDKNKGVNIKPGNLDLNQPAPASEEPCWGLDMMQVILNSFMVVFLKRKLLDLSLNDLFYFISLKIERIKPHQICQIKSN